jgi:hypothetical protein
MNRTSSPPDLQVPLPIQAVLDCLSLLRQHQEDLVTSSRPHSIPLPLMRLEFRLLYLLISAPYSGASISDRSRFLELARLLHCSPDQGGSLPPLPAPFNPAFPCKG